MAPRSEQILVPSADLDESIQTMITEFRLAAEYDVQQTKKLAVNMNLEPHKGTHKIINKLTSHFKARDLTYGEDILQTEYMTDEQFSWTPNEVGLKVIIPDLTLRRIGDPGFYSKIGSSMARAYRIREDQDGCDMLGSFTGTTLGSAGTTFTLGHPATALSWLRTGGGRRRTATTEIEPNAGPFYGMVHSFTMARVLGNLVPFGATSAGTGSYTGAAGANTITVGNGKTKMSDKLLWSGMPYNEPVTISGIPIYQNDNLLVDSNDDVTSAFWDKSGFVHLSELEPQEGVTIDYSARAKEVVMWGSYVFGVYDPAQTGHRAIFDATPLS
jgi:hypothetical protein